MTVQFVKPRGLCVKGQIVEGMDDRLAASLILRGYCVEVKAEEEKPSGFVPFRNKKGAKAQTKQ